MFTIGNAAKNQAFNRSGVSADPKSPLYKELAARYSYVRDPLLSPADDVNFQDFIRRKIMEKAARAAKEDKEGPAPGKNNNNGDGDVVPHRTIEEQKKKSRLPLKKVRKFLCM